MLLACDVFLLFCADCAQCAFGQNVYTALYAIGCFAHCAQCVFGRLRAMCFGDFCCIECAYGAIICKIGRRCGRGRGRGMCRQKSCCAVCVCVCCCCLNSAVVAVAAGCGRLHRCSSTESQEPGPSASPCADPTEAYRKLEAAHISHFPIRPYWPREPLRAVHSSSHDTSDLYNYIT
jgi:hypothetical protein